MTHNRQTSISTTNCMAESAAVVFSNTFLPSQDQPRSPRWDTTRRPRAYISALPTELLLIIFRIVYLKSRVPVPNHFTDDSAYKSVWASDQNLLSPSLFPYALASVSPRWRAIMSTVAVFWTRIVILVDTNPTPLRAIESYFRWTRDLPLDVAVMRKPGTFEEDDPGEKARVAAVMGLLAPHVCRCHNLHFDIIYSSSLPSLRRDFHGVASELESLRLECQVDDGRNDPSDVVEHGTFACPVLRWLVIDGRNFMDSCMIDARPFTNASAIKILHFSPSESDDESLSLYQVLESLLKFDKLLWLAMSDIEFDFASGSYQAYSFPLSSSFVTFEDLSDEVLTEYFDVTSAHPEAASFTRCSIDTFDNVSGDCLILEGIAVDQDLTPFLGEWLGSTLYLTNCPGFDDSFLAGLGGIGHLDDNFAAPNMDGLMITDCPNFSVVALREMLDARRRNAPAYQHDDDWFNNWRDNNFDESTVSRIGKVEVCGCGPLISAEDSEWFLANLAEFRWRTTLPDGRTCHVEKRT